MSINIIVRQLPVKETRVLDTISFFYDGITNINKQYFSFLGQDFENIFDFYKMDEGRLNKNFYKFLIIDKKLNIYKKIIGIDISKDEFRNYNYIRVIGSNFINLITEIKAKNIGIIIYNLSIEMNIKLFFKAFIEGIILGSYEFKKFKTTKTLKENITIQFFLPPDTKEELKNIIKESYNLSLTVNKMRDIINEPSNFLTPEVFCAHTVNDMEELNNIDIDIMTEKNMLDRKFSAILSVGKGSTNKPYFLIVRYKGDLSSKKTIGLVGKGVTFDSGGIDIKTGESIRAMSFDMSGAGAVLGTLEALSKNNIKVNVNAYIPLAENMPGSNSYKPGDIINTYKGKTVEIVSTDAEGRLLLADALTYATKDCKVNLVIDVATLTGAVSRVFGNVSAGVMTNKEELLPYLQKASNISNEKISYIPLYEEYKHYLKSHFADLKNSGGALGSTAVAGAFLKEFIENNTPWIHIDIAGTAYTFEDNTMYKLYPYIGEYGASGFSIRLLYEFIKLITKYNILEKI